MAKGYKLEKKIELVPSERATAIERVIEVFNETNPDMHKAFVTLERPYENAMSQLAGALAPQKAAGTCSL